ncbi:MAG: chemotaxis protein CheX [Vicinamibacterales bacterium]
MAVVSQDDIVRIAGDIWRSVLDADLRVLDAGTADLRGPTLAGVVQITGAWVGAVAVELPAPLAARLATTMFRLAGRAATEEEEADALGEIANMVGGGVKGMLDGCCHLSLPAVVAGHGFRVRVPGGRAIQETWFECRTERFVVRLLAVPDSQPQPEIALPGASISG